MKIVFLSNYLNHHQLPLCLAFSKLGDVDFTFIATTRTPQFRLRLGYHNMNEEYGFVLRTYESRMNVALAQTLCTEADVVITGVASDKFIEERLKTHKLTFRYSERVYKDGCKLYELPARAVKYFFKHGRYRSLYMLCASAYTAPDYAKTLTFIGKTYKWGYFPEVKTYDDINALISQKKPNSLLWVGRFIECKHIELAIETAKYLKDNGLDFTLDIIGSGSDEQEIRQSISNLGLEGYIKLLGSMSPEKVREYMEQSEIFLFTSDRRDGWGAVLNEAMNSACAVVSDINIGATPFLVKDGINGFSYKTGDKKTLFEKTRLLLENKDIRCEMAVNAYNTMRDEWNGEVAAERFVALAKELAQNNKCALYSDGPCSKA